MKDSLTFFFLQMCKKWKLWWSSWLRSICMQTFDLAPQVSLYVILSIDVFLTQLLEAVAKILFSPFKGYLLFKHWLQKLSRQPNLFFLNFFRNFALISRYYAIVTLKIYIWWNLVGILCTFVDISVYCSYQNVSELLDIYVALEYLVSMKCDYR